MKNYKHPNIEVVAISDLKLNPHATKRHSEEHVSRIILSISRWGWLVPIIIDDDNMIIAGHGRYNAALQMGDQDVPCIRAKFVTDADKRAFALAENRIPELSTTDKTLLNKELTFLFENDVEIEITGYSVADIEFKIEVPPQEEPEPVPLPDASQRAVSRVGDLWLVGPHRLICGDARLRETWEWLMGDERATLMFADYPYNVPIDGFVSGNGKVRHREFVMAAGEMSPAEFTAFLRTISRNAVLYTVDGSIHYLCMDWRHMREMLDATDGIYTEHKQLIVWKKTNAGQGTFYRSEHELVFVFKSGRSKHINNFKLGETGRYRTNVVEYAGANTFRKDRDKDLEAHSTVKPTAMVMDFILDCSHKGDLVMDPCVGSGTTLIAAHHTKRRGAGMELDPLYCDVALARLSDAVGQPPILQGDGRTFEAIQAERLGLSNACDGEAAQLATSSL